MRLDLDGLAAASREALMAEWHEVVARRPPKHLSKPLMLQILGHAYQLDTVGRYTKRLDGRLTPPTVINWGQHNSAIHIPHSRQLRIAHLGTQKRQSGNAFC